MASVQGWEKSWRGTNWKASGGVLCVEVFVATRKRTNFVRMYEHRFSDSFSLRSLSEGMATIYVLELQEFGSDIFGFPVIVLPKPGFPERGISTLYDETLSRLRGMISFSIQHTPPCIYIFASYGEVCSFLMGKFDLPSADCMVP